MQFRPIPVAPALQRYIRNYWTLTFRVLYPGGTQRIMTNGATCMMYFPNTGRLILYGPSMHNVAIDFEPGEHVILGVEFHPAGVHAFFKKSTAEFVDQQLTDEQLGEAFVKYSQQLAELPNIEDYAEVADAFYLKQMADIGRAEDINMQRMMRVFAYIETHLPTDIRLGDLAKEACVGPRQFNRIFTEYVGLTPKEYLRIYRFHAALMALREHPEHTTLMQLAWDNGYYDLKHMTTDFRDICSHAPKSDEISKRLTETFGQTFSLLMKKKILPINVD
ncbi:MAG: helix-turn-helix transcriptional regulator [Bacteroidales bacterium]|nr:helix-turn-helix transcriptional regulator [Candidatus Colicola coprequi]